MSERSERNRRGSTFGTSRINAAAEKLAAEARVYKKAKQNQQAHDLYTQAIKLDRFNHKYFHHRAETAMNGKVRFACAVLIYIGTHDT